MGHIGFSIKESLELRTSKPGHTDVFIEESLELRTRELDHTGDFIKRVIGTKDTNIWSYWCLY